MTSFTHGPWRAVDHMVVVVAETHGYDTCVASAAYGGAGGDERLANARLIASAPELLGALEGLVDIIRQAGLQNLMRGVQLGQVSWSVKASDRMELAAAAIAKATGVPS